MGSRGQERGREEGREETGIRSPLPHAAESMKVPRITSSREQAQRAAIAGQTVAAQQLVGVKTVMAANAVQTLHKVTG